MREALASHRRLVYALGSLRARRFAAWAERHVAQVAGNLALALLFGLAPAVAHFFGLPIELRHVTLAAGRLLIAAGAIGWRIVLEPAFWLALAGVLAAGRGDGIRLRPVAGAAGARLADPGAPAGAARGAAALPRGAVRLAAASSRRAAGSGASGAGRRRGGEPAPARSGRGIAVVLFDQAVFLVGGFAGIFGQGFVGACALHQHADVVDLAGDFLCQAPARRRRRQREFACLRHAQQRVVFRYRRIRVAYIGVEPSLERVERRQQFFESPGADSHDRFSRSAM
jgi:hypothetical protein